MNIVGLTVIKVTSLLLLLLLFSCAEVRTLTPSSRFISPESAHDTGHGSVQAFYQMGTESTLNANENEFDKPMDLDASARFSMGLDVNIYEKINLFYFTNQDSAPLFGMKYQLMGPNKKEAKKGDQSLAITLGGGGSSEAREDENAIFDDSDFHEVRVHRNLLDASIIYGKRIEERVLWYSSVQITQHRLHVAIEDDSSSLNGESIDYQTTNLGAASGIMLYDKKGRFHFAIEASYQKTKWTKNDESHRAFINGAMGFNW